MLSPCVIMAGVTPAGACATAERALSASASSRARRVRVSIVAPQGGGEPAQRFIENKARGGRVKAGAELCSWSVRPLAWTEGRLRAAAQGRGTEDGGVIVAPWIPEHPGRNS